MFVADCCSYVLSSSFQVTITMSSNNNNNNINNRINAAAQPCGTNTGANGARPCATTTEANAGARGVPADSQHVKDIPEQDKRSAGEEKWLQGRLPPQGAPITQNVEVKDDVKPNQQPKLGRMGRDGPRC